MRILSYSIALLCLALPGLTQAKTTTVASFSGSSVVYFDDTVLVTSQDINAPLFHAMDELPNATTTMTIYSSAGEKLDQYTDDDFPYIYTPSASMYTTVLSPVSGQAIQFKGDYYFAVMVNEVSALDIGSVATEVWRLPAGKQKPERVAHLDGTGGGFFTAVSPVISINDALYIIGDNGTVERSSNGDDWSNIGTTDGIEETGTYKDLFAQAGRAYAVTSLGVYSSGDALHWKKISTFCDNVIDCDFTQVVAANDTVVAVQHHFNYDTATASELLWQRDPAGNWTNIAKAKYGFSDVSVANDQILASKWGDTHQNKFATYRVNTNGSLHRVAHGKGYITTAVGQNLLVAVNLRKDTSKLVGF